MGFSIVPISRITGKGSSLQLHPAIIPATFLKIFFNQLHRVLMVERKQNTFRKYVSWRCGWSFKLFSFQFDSDNWWAAGVKNFEFGI